MRSCARAETSNVGHQWSGRYTINSIGPQQFVEILDVEGEQTVEITLLDEDLQKILGGF